MRTILSRAISLMCVLVFMGAQTANAQQDPRLLYYPYYSPIVGAACGGVGDANFAGSNNIQIAYNYFVSAGLSSHQSAGIVGNLIYESNGVNPNSKQGGNGTLTFASPSEITPGTGFGIAQWTNGGRQQNWLTFAAENNEDPMSLELQLKFLFHELETTPAYGLAELRAAQDVRQATWIFLVFFERPAGTSGYEENPNQATEGTAKVTLDTRVDLAQPVIDNFEGESSGSYPCATISTGEPDYSANPNIQVDGSPPGGHKESNCTGSFTAGAASLKAFVLQEWSPPVTLVGGYSCRPIVGGSSTSIHGLGRAIDIMVLATTPEGLATGDSIRNHLINNAERYGVQRVIWNRKTWVANRDGWNDYNGENDHTDHLHVEINLAASINANLAP